MLRTPIATACSVSAVKNHACTIATVRATEKLSLGLEDSPAPREQSLIGPIPSRRYFLSVSVPRNQMADEGVD